VVDDVGVFEAVVGEAADVDLVGAVAAAGEAASPGPLTTQPMTDKVSGVVMCARRSSSRSTVLMTSNCWRAQDGQEMTVTPRRRRLSDFRISKPALTSSTGSADSEMRIVSPMPDHSSMPSPMEDLTVPLRRAPASVIPRWSG
jgi:hypothetical protein